MRTENMGLRQLHRFLNGPESDPLTYVHPYVSPYIKSLIANIPPSVEMLMVWGSSIKDYMLDDSDIDLIVIPTSAKQDFWKLLDSVERIRAVDTIFFDSYEDIVQQAKDYFPGAREVLDTALIVYNKNGETWLE